MYNIENLGETDATPAPRPTIGRDARDNVERGLGRLGLGFGARSRICRVVGYRKDTAAKKCHGAKSPSHSSQHGTGARTRHRYAFFERLHDRYSNDFVRFDRIDLFVGRHAPSPTGPAISRAPPLIAPSPPSSLPPNNSALPFHFLRPSAFRATSPIQRNPHPALSLGLLGPPAQALRAVR
jgi:hypothetical protein